MVVMADPYIVRGWAQKRAHHYFNTDFPFPHLIRMRVIYPAVNTCAEGRARMRAR